MRARINYPYKFKLKPSSHQENLLRQVGGSTRWIYNHYLATRKVRSVSAWCRDLTQLKKSTPWLQAVPSQTLQQKIKDLHTAWDRFFKHQSGKPKLESKNKQTDSFRFPQRFKLANNRVFLPKLGWYKFYKSREVRGTIKSVTVKQQSDGWYVIFLTEQEIDINLQKPKAIGLDLGIETFCTLSDGTKFESLNPLKKYLKKLRKESRKLSRKKKKSKSRAKQRLRLARVHKKVANLRNDYLHKISTYLAKNHSLVCTEDLNIKGMAKNRKLARAISDQGWSKFLSMLKYKCYWYGSRLVKVDRWFASSKTCSECGCIKKDLALKDRTYHCSDCGLELDRDFNAALNILNKGTGGQSETSSLKLVKACGDYVRPTSPSGRQSLKQEPIRACTSLTRARD